MTSEYMPVETVLRVDDSELLIEESKDIEQLSPISSNCVSIGTQYDWKIEQSDGKPYNLLSDLAKNDSTLEVVDSENAIIPDKISNSAPMVIRSWPIHPTADILSNQKILIPASFSQQFACETPSISEDEKILLQLDYKTRNKFKTKQRRMDPYYRSQERLRQRAVMRMKRQDPGFRAAEREKGRFRMRLKRLDPEFRTQERERQRERMKAKRSDPEFRERERAQQKCRLHEKRMDPVFKEKERAQDRLRMRMKRQNNTLQTKAHVDNVKVCNRNENIDIVPGKMLKDICKSDDSAEETPNYHVTFPEHFNVKLSFKPRDSVIESFHLKKQHIMNFNFCNINKEQLSNKLYSKSMTQMPEFDENNVFQSISMSETNNDLSQKAQTLSGKNIYKTEDCSEPILNINSSELPVTEIKKSKCSSDQEISN